jgi:hypothetical protein
LESSNDGVGVVALQSKSFGDGVCVVTLYFNWNFAKKFWRWHLDFIHDKFFEAFNLP